jgi:diguanylate cyclase (GGDEF)-like protein
VFSTTAITDEQLHAMWQACGEIASESDSRRACRRLAERLSGIIGAPTAVFRRDVAPWRLVAKAAPGAQAPVFPVPLISELDELARAVHSSLVPGAASGSEPAWTPLPIDEELPSQCLLLLPGNWNVPQTRHWLPRFAQTASLAVRLAAARASARRSDGLSAVAYSFARKLGQISGERALNQFIADAGARTVNARLGALALYNQSAAAISIGATSGYSLEAVAHVRILPGTGIIGGVFATKKPLLVRDTTRVPGLVSRSTRYKTRSFMAVPLLSGADCIGVLTFADRDDGRPFDRSDLTVARIIAALAALALVRDALSRRTEELAHTAAIDPLTSMFNRRYLQGRLDAEIERTRRTGAPVGVLMLDVDTFKGINDQLGHQAGDAVLRRVAEIIRRSVRVSDVCTRYGGDEFAIIVPENANTAAHTAERIRQRVDSYRWDTLGIPQALHVTVSIGVATSEPGDTADALVAKADRMLYQAKAEGRNCVRPAEH